MKAFKVGDKVVLTALGKRQHWAGNYQGIRTVQMRRGGRLAVHRNHIDGLYVSARAEHFEYYNIIHIGGE